MTRPVLLDTHVWVWLMLGDTRLGSASRRVLEKAVPDGRLRVSVISIWEVAMLEAKGRLTLAADCDSWVRDALAAPGVRLAELTPHIAIASTRLPGVFHGDPADRMLIATARELGATLLTADRAILQYGRAGYVHAASVARAGRPVARLVPLASAPRAKRSGLLRGHIRIGADFDKPLPDQVLALFEGRGR